MEPTSPTSVAATGDDSLIESISLTKTDDPWKCPASAKSLRTVNPIRAIVDPIMRNMRSGEERGDGKNLITLALGDPTASGNLHACPAALQAISRTLQTKGNAAGYVNACGSLEARIAVADLYNRLGAQVSYENVVIANGCSGALELALTALLDTDTILLVPKPGFPLYQVIAESHGASVLHYPLLPDKGWECDLEALSKIMAAHGAKVRGMILCNPSNPTGSVFSETHLASLVAFAEQHRLPLIADEVYGDLTFGSHKFHPLSAVASKAGRRVPIITTSGLGKQYLVPGWRAGWVVFQDNVFGSMCDVEDGTKRLAQVILGASHLVQQAIPAALAPDDEAVSEWKANLVSTLESQAYELCNLLENCPGLHVPMKPQGAMYAMVKIDLSKFDTSVESDLEFCSSLLEEENIFVLPGSAFGVPGAFRVVFCASSDTLRAAADRIKKFCLSHLA